MIEYYSTYISPEKITEAKIDLVADSDNTSTDLATITDEQALIYLEDMKQEQTDSFLQIMSKILISDQLILFSLTDKKHIILTTVSEFEALINSATAFRLCSAYYEYGADLLYLYIGSEVKQYTIWYMTDKVMKSLAANPEISNKDIRKFWKRFSLQRYV